MPYEGNFRRQIEEQKSYSVAVNRRNLYAKTVSPDDARRVKEIGRAHPNLDPKIVGAAAFHGLDANDPSLMQLSAAAIKKQEKSGGSWLGKLGSVVTAPIRAGLNTGVGEWISQAGKAGIRGAMVGVETGFQVLGGGLRNIASAPGVGQLGEIAAGALAGAGAGFAAGAITPWSAVAGAVGGAVVGGVGGALADPVKGEFVNPFSQSSGGQVIKKLVTGQDVDLGEGFFTGGQIHEDTLAMQRKAATIDGHALTGGRLIADGFSRPGTTSFNIMSGLIDFANVLKYDPTILAGKELKAARADWNSILPGVYKQQSPTMRFLAGKKKALGENIELVDEAVEAAPVEMIDEVVPPDPADLSVDMDYAQEYVKQQGYPKRSYMNDPRVAYDDLIVQMDEVLPPEARQLRDTYVSGEFEGVSQSQSRQALQNLLPYLDDPDYQAALHQGLEAVGLPEEFIAFRGVRKSQQATEGVLNVTLDPGTAKSFGDVQAVKVRREDVVAFGNRGERELIVRAEGAQQVGLSRPVTRQVPKNALDTEDWREAGLIPAEANVVDYQAAENFLGTDRMKNIIREIAAEGSTSTIRNMLNKKINPDLANRLAKASTEADVADVLRESILRRTVMEKNALDTGRGLLGTVRTYKKQSPLANWADAKTERLRAYIPQGGIDLTHMDIAPHKLGRAADYLESYMVGVGIDEAERTQWLDRLMESTDSAMAQETIEHWVTTSLSGKLRTLGWDDASVLKVIQGYRHAKEDMLEAIQDQFQDVQLRLEGVVIDGEVNTVAKGNRVSDYIENVIELPDVREVRRLTTPDWKLDPRRIKNLKKADELEAAGDIEGARALRLEWEQPKQMAVTLFGKELTASRRALYNSGLWKGSTSLLDTYMGRFWRPATLLRPAWTVRLIMDEASRMAAQGLVTPIAHPFSLIVALVTGKGSTYSKLDATGNLLSRTIQHQEAMAGAAAMGGKRRPAMSKYKRVYNKMEDGAGEAWTATLIQMHKDEVTRRVARDGVEATTEWFLSDAGRAAREQVERVLNKPGVGAGGARAQRHILDVEEDIKAISGAGPGGSAGDPQIRQAIAGGRLRGYESTTLLPGSVAPLDEQAEKWVEKSRGGKGFIVRGDRYGSAKQKVARMQKRLPEGYHLTTNTYRLRKNQRVIVKRSIPESVVVENKGLTALSSQEQASLVSKRIKDLKRERRLSQMNRGEVAQIDEQIELLEKKGYAALLDELDGIALSRSDGRGIINEDAARELQRRLRDPRINTPEEIMGPVEITKQNLTKLDRATEWMFNHLLSMPTDYLSRSPAFVQVYWRKMAEAAPSMTKAAQATMMENALKTGLDRETLARLKMAMKDGKHGLIELEDIDEVAKAHAVDKLKTIFDDMTNKKAYDEALRHVMPFGNAWRQATTQWAKIFIDDPSAIRKVQLGAQAPRGFDPDADGQGFFHKDDQGEWVFNYPWSEKVTGMMTGSPFPMQGKVAGVSMVSSSLLPGFGPMVSIAASRILPNTPEMDDVRKLFAPYGDPAAQEGWLGQLAPPWMDKVKQALSDPEVNQLQGSTTVDVMRYLVSTGKFDTSTPEGQNALLEAAESRAKMMTLLRAGYQAFGPAAPKIVPMAQDKNGDTVVSQVLMKRMAELQEKDYSTATEEFLKEFGDNAWMFMQAKTRASNPGVTNLDTTEGLDFARDNPELVKLLPNTYGFFAPPASELGEDAFDYTARLRLIKTGEREVLTPKEQMELAMDKVGSMVFFNIKDSLGPKISREQQSILRDLKAHLMEKYPGFGTARIGLDTRAETPQLIEELAKAVQLDTVKATPVGRDLANYLSVRDRVQAISESRGRASWTSSEDNQDLREIMRELGNMLSSRTPGFNLLFERVLVEEMDA